MKEMEEVKEIKEMISCVTELYIFGCGLYIFWGHDMSMMVVVYSI